MDFRKYTEENLNLVRKYASRVSTLSYFYQASNIALWSEAKKIEIAEGNFALFVKFSSDSTFLMPFCFESELLNALKELEEYCEKKGWAFKVTNIPEEYFSVIQNSKYSFTRDRDSDEYLYEKDKLISLSGGRLQPKRNHISQFVRLYPNYHLEKLDKKNFPKCLIMAREWINKAHKEYRKDLENEYLAIENAMRVWNEFNFSGVILYVDETLVAFTLGEIVNDELIVYFEKANFDYKGSYTVINREYLLGFSPKATIVNRQEDVGAPGLRKAKLSYYPVHMVEKYTITK